MCARRAALAPLFGSPPHTAVVTGNGVKVIDPPRRHARGFFDRPHIAVGDWF